MKSHMRRYLNEGNDLNSPSDMKRALDSYGGVKSCRVAAVDVEESKQVLTDHKWKGIHLITLNFLAQEYESGKRSELAKVNSSRTKCSRVWQATSQAQVFALSNHSAIQRKIRVRLKESVEKTDQHRRRLRIPMTLPPMM